MKYYFAGGEGFNLEQYGVKNVLTSFYYIEKKEPQFLVNNPHNMDIFLDCGAYSAWTHGETIDVHAYAQFLLKYKQYINVYPNLDVKGSIEETLKNQKILEDYGLNPIPVFHVNTRRWDILEKYIDKYPYIALGAIAGEGGSSAVLDSDFNNIFARAKRNPLTKFHGFGVSSLPLLKKYPFYSSDSTSWLAGGRFGALYADFSLTKEALGKHAQQEKISKALNYREMMRRNVRAFLKMEKDLTLYWKMRGIEFID